MDEENFPQLPLIFVCKLTLSENCCCRGPLLPILQGHPVQHPRWIWYEFQAANSNGGGALGSNMMASGWREFSTIALDYFCNLKLSKNCCCRSLLLPILQGHPVQHPRWIWYEFQATHGNGGGALGSNMMTSWWREFSTIALDFCLWTNIVWKLLLPRPSPPNITGPSCPTSMVNLIWTLDRPWQWGGRIRHQGSLIADHLFSCWNSVLLYCLFLLQFYWTMSSKGNKHTAGSLTAKSPASNKKQKLSLLWLKHLGTMHFFSQVWGKSIMESVFCCGQKLFIMARFLMVRKHTYSSILSKMWTLIVRQLPLILTRNVLLRTETSSKTTRILLMTIQPLKIINLKSWMLTMNCSMSILAKSINESMIWKKAKKRKQKMRKSGSPMMCRTWPISFM